MCWRAWIECLSEEAEADLAVIRVRALRESHAPMTENSSAEKSLTIYNHHHANFEVFTVRGSLGSSTRLGHSIDFCRNYFYDRSQRRQ